MAINVQNLIDVVNAKLIAADSATPAQELIKLYQVKNDIDASVGVLSYGSLKSLPSASGANAGEIVFIDDTKYDKYGTFYFSNGLEWTRLNLTTDSDEDQISFLQSFPGKTYGYVAGGSTPSLTAVIDRYSFASDDNAVNIGNLLVTKEQASGQRSSTYAYTAGGVLPAATNQIEKFEFFNETNVIDVGDLVNSTFRNAGHSSTTDGYISGGRVNTITQKFPFSTDTNATNVGTLLYNLDYVSGLSSFENNSAYVTGGFPPGADYIQKFPFSNESTSTLIGSLTVARYWHSSQSGFLYGYTFGTPTIAYNNIIDKFPFSAEVPSTEVGYLLNGTYEVSGSSSQTHIYATAGYPTSNIIQKWPQISDANATDVGDLTIGRVSATGNHV